MCDPVTMTALVGSALSIAGSGGAAAAGMTAAEAAAAGLTGGAANIAMGLGAAGAAGGLSTGTLFASSLGISALTEGVNFLGQRQANSAAKQSAQLQIQQDQLNTTQSETSQALDLQQKDIEASQARATARTSAGESGVTGNSLDALVNDYTMAEGRYRTGVAMQAGMNRQQAGMRQVGYMADAAQRAPAPSPFASVLRVGGTALDQYNKLYGKPPKQD